MFYKKISWVMILLSTLCSARTYLLDNPKNDIIGTVIQTYVQPQDSLTRIAQRTNTGFYELIEANHYLDPKNLRIGQAIVIPSQYILPNAPREGIIINLAEMRLYYFPKNRKNIVISYPVGIGRRNWATPKGVMRIVEKRRNPIWYVPESIRKARLADGVVLPKKILPGPDNPLGEYAMRLSKRLYLIHGTNQPAGVGRRSSSGCIRLYPEDIEELFTKIALNTKVKIVDQPYKVGWLDGELYLEVHEPLHEYPVIDFREDLKSFIREKLKLKQHLFGWIQIDWNRVEKIIKEQNGIPAVIATTWY